MSTATPTLRLLALLLLALPQLACVSSRSVRYVSDDTRLAARELPDGSEVSWDLHSSRAGAPTLDRTDRVARDVARFGITTRSITEQRAEAYGVPAWRGVRIDSVARDSAAERAGLRAGDLLISVGGTVVSSSEMLTGVVQALDPEQVVEIVVRRRVEGNRYEPGETLVEIDPDAERVTDSTTESIELETSEVVQQLTGLQAAELPADLSAEVLGTDGATVLVAAVGPGTPAYRSGLRAGDRFVAIDGAPVGSLDDLRVAVLGRADERGISVSSNERPLDGRTRSAEGRVRVEVRGPLGSHAAELDVRADLDERSEVEIPILFERSSDVASTRWSFLDFIFQFGANYRGQYLESKTREAARSTYFSMLPFGFFEVERDPKRSRYCIFWFIEWERRR